MEQGLVNKHASGLHLHLVIYLCILLMGNLGEMHEQ